MDGFIVDISNKNNTFMRCYVGLMTTRSSCLLSELVNDESTIALGLKGCLLRSTESSGG